MSYIHIFTDGVDKLLSVSIWFKWYGGKDSFCFYKNNSLRGYISEKEFEKLRYEGGKLLHNKKFVQDLFSESEDLTSSVLAFKKKLKDNHMVGKHPLSKISSLLETCYKNYFYTEEYYTDNLNPSLDKELIERIGTFRFSFINTCISATKMTHDLANKIVKDTNAEFLTIDEILQGEVPDGIKTREKAFLLIQKNHKLTLHTGFEAEKQYKTLSHKKQQIQKTLSGMGASQGKVKGSVYKISLTSHNLHKQIENMPDKSVLVTESTQPQLILACNKAIAIVTNEGGVLSHAAIVSRELGIPCVVGTRNATEILNDGDKILVNGTSGEVIIID